MLCVNGVASFPDDHDIGVNKCSQTELSVPKWKLSVRKPGHARRKPELSVPKRELSVRKPQQLAPETGTRPGRRQLLRRTRCPPGDGPHPGRRGSGLRRPGSKPSGTPPGRPVSGTPSRLALITRFSSLIGKLPSRQPVTGFTRKGCRAHQFSANSCPTGACGELWPRGFLLSHREPSGSGQKPVGPGGHADQQWSSMSLSAVFSSSVTVSW